MMWETFKIAVVAALGLVAVFGITYLVFTKVSITCVDFFTKFCAVVIK